MRPGMEYAWLGLLAVALAALGERRPAVAAVDPLRTLAPADMALLHTLGLLVVAALRCAAAAAALHPRPTIQPT